VTRLPGDPGRQPGAGNKLLLAVLLVGLGLTWWKAPAFFRGTEQGICGLELRYPPALRQVVVARVDGRDTPRPLASGGQLAIPCGQPLEIRYSRAATAQSGEAAAQGQAAPHGAAHKRLDALDPAAAPETRTLSPDELKPGVTLVELR